MDNIIKAPQKPEGERDLSGGSGVAHVQAWVIMRKLFAFTAQAQSCGVRAQPRRCRQGGWGVIKFLGSWCADIGVRG